MNDPRDPSSPERDDADPAPRAPDPAHAQDAPAPAPRETGGPQGLEPTRYGDWERNGRCIDF